MPRTISEWRAKQEQFQEDARKQLRELLIPGTVVYVLTRMVSRSSKTSVVEYIVVRDNVPIFISKRIATLLEMFDIPEPPHAGIVLHKVTPQYVIHRVMEELNLRTRVEVKAL